MNKRNILKYVDCDRCKWLDKKQPLYCSKFKKNLIESEYWNDEYCVMFEDKVDSEDVERAQQIWDEACHRYADYKSRRIFVTAAEWADSHPQWHDAQGNNVPEYGREVIVIGRDGKVFYGHRPNPKEVTMVEGKPYHAKTYDKNGWNWPDIALWLDVEIPDELIDEITTKYFNEQKAIT